MPVIASLRPKSLSPIEAVSSGQCRGCVERRSLRPKSLSPIEAVMYVDR